jgi:hypothetical protein
MPGIDWSTIQAAMDRRAELAKLPHDMLATFADDTAEDLADAERELAASWVPIPLEAQRVQPGDVIVGKDAALLAVAEVDDPRDVHGKPVGDAVAIWTAAVSGVASSWRVPRDRVVRVLVPYPEREALILARTELGARITGRKIG